jgi:hypothetical protein
MTASTPRRNDKPPQTSKRASGSTARGTRRLTTRQRDRARLRLPSVQEVVTHHGLSRDEYVELLERQGTRCGICRRFEFLRLDRDEVSREVRGLLCSLCLDGLRLLDSDLRRLFRSYFYIAYPPRHFASQRLAASERYAGYLRRWLDRQIAAVAS